MTPSHEEFDLVRAVRRLTDRAAIADVQIQYASGTDNRDWALFRRCFTDEVEVDFSEGLGQPAVTVAADDWVRSTAPRMESFEATQHMMTNMAITFEDDDHATCVTYVRARHHLPNFTGSSDQTVYGFYTNRFLRTPDGWRIASLKLTTKWMTGNFGIFQTTLAPPEGRV